MALVSLHKEKKWEERLVQVPGLPPAKVRVRWDADEGGLADLSYLGKYVAEWQEGAIDRKLQGDWEAGEMQWWMPSSNHYPHKPKNWSHVVGANKEAVIKQYGSFRKADEAYVLQDYRRMEDFEDGKWWTEFCVVEAEIGALKAKAALHGIESDSGDQYRREIEDSQVHEALAVLRKKIMDRISIE